MSRRVGLRHMQSVFARAGPLKKACRIMGFGYVVTPQFKGVCLIASVFALAARYRLTCQPTSVGGVVSPSKFLAPVTSVGGVVSPSKFVAPITSAFSVSVA